MKGEVGAFLSASHESFALGIFGVLLHLSEKRRGLRIIPWSALLFGLIGIGLFNSIAPVIAKAESLSARGIRSAMQPDTLQLAARCSRGGMSERLDQGLVMGGASPPRIELGFTV